MDEIILEISHTARRVVGRFVRTFDFYFTCLEIASVAADKSLLEFTLL